MILIYIFANCWNTWHLKVPILSSFLLLISLPQAFKRSRRLEVTFFFLEDSRLELSSLASYVVRIINSLHIFWL